VAASVRIDWPIGVFLVAAFAVIAFAPFCAKCSMEQGMQSEGDIFGRWLMRGFLMVSVCFGLGACDVLTRTEYIPEVGYREGEREIWWLGERTRSKEDCVRAAAGKFNAINNDSSRRAFSWACRVMKGESFEERTRG
jgi:hypothetical protein